MPFDCGYFQLRKWGAGMYCTKCGNEIKNKTKFCTLCGNKINVVSLQFEEEKQNTPPQTKVEKVKKKKAGISVLVISLAFILLISAGGFAAWKMGVIVLPWLQRDNTELSDFCTSFAKDYTVVAKNADGVTVEIEAPDFAAIAQKALKNEKSDVDKAILEKYIAENPRLTKVYQISADSEEKSKIEEALLQKISYDLVVEALSQVKFKRGAEE